MKKRIVSVLLSALLFALGAVPALAIVEKSDSFYVADEAGVLSDATKKEIINWNGELEYYCDGAQIVVVTTEYSEGLASDEYAYRLFNDWGVGKSGANNGMLLLLITEENKAWLATGAGIDRYFTNAVAAGYLDSYFWKKFDKGDFNGAVSSLFPKLVSWYQDHYGVGSDSGESIEQVPEEYEQYQHSNGIISAIRSNPYIVIFVIWGLYLIISAIARDRRRYYDYHTRMGIPMAPYHIWYILQSHAYHDYHDRNNHGGGGGFWGGGGFGGGSGGGGFGGGGFHGGSGFGGGGFGGGGGAGRR